MRGRAVLSLRKVPQEALLRRPQHEFTAVIALAPAHAIRALVLGIPALTGLAARA